MLHLLVLAWAFTLGNSRLFGGYFPNWAQYREDPYTFVPSNLDDIAEKITHVVYTHVHFSMENYSIIPTDKNDLQFLRKIAAYRNSLQEFKLLVSIGGDEFPSESFSTMVSSNKARAAFVANVKTFLEKYGIDGVEISWKWPCSPPKIIRKQHFRSCNNYSDKIDGGSRCPKDAFNFLSLLEVMRSSLGEDTIIALSGSPFPEVIKMTPLKVYSKFVDHWHVETYGYALAATNHSYVAAPHSPLYPPPGYPHPHSISNTVEAYLTAGVPSNKIVIGVPLHGSFWYVPDLIGDEWQTFGLQASSQGKCCGPYRLTYGARGGPASNTCGRYMYSEILAIQDANLYYDKGTQTMVGYLKHDSGDGWTQGGTWFSYNSKESIKALTEYIKLKKLGGAFVSDISEDSLDFTTRKFTYELIDEIYSGLQEGDGGDGSGNNSGHICDPMVGCNVCMACCHPYLTSQFDCNACVTIKCMEQVCYPPEKCSVCSSCCTSYSCTQMQCNYCVKNKC